MESSKKRTEDLALREFNLLTLRYAGYSRAEIRSFGDPSQLSEERMNQFIINKALELFGKEFAEKMKRGPVMMLTVWPSGASTSMGKNLALWFCYSVVVGIFAAYVAGRALPGGAPYLQVFRFAGATAFVGYSVALWQMSIWYRRAWRTTLKATVDGLVYALLTAGTFGWLWPR